MIENKIDTEMSVIPEIPYEEPCKDIGVGNITITLCREMIQQVNNELHITFTTKATMDEIKNAFSTNQSAIMYDTQSYNSYNVIDQLSYKHDNEGLFYYEIVLLDKEAKTKEQEYAIQYALQNITDKEALRCMSLFPEYKTNVSYKKDYRFRYKNCLYKVLCDHVSQPDTFPEVCVEYYKKII